MGYTESERGNVRMLGLVWLWKQARLRGKRLLGYSSRPNRTPVWNTDLMSPKDMQIRPGQLPANQYARRRWYGLNESVPSCRRVVDLLSDDKHSPWHPKSTLNSFTEDLNYFTWPGSPKVVSSTWVVTPGSAVTIPNSKENFIMVIFILILLWLVTSPIYRKLLSCLCYWNRLFLNSYHLNNIWVEKTNLEEISSWNILKGIRRVSKLDYPMTY